MRHQLVAIGILLALFWASDASAACSGSGLTWSCTAGSTASQINTAISSASDGATVTLAAGSYSAVRIDLSPRNGVTVICASVGGCNMTGTSDPVFVIETCTAHKTNLMRVSGFKFVGTRTFAIWMYCANSSFNITKLRLDHLECDNIGLANFCIHLGEGSYVPADVGEIWGVADHLNCHSSNANNFVCLKNTSGGTAWTTGTQGSASSFFIEDSVCSFAGRSDFGTGCFDNWHANSTVIRFNTVVGSVIRDHSYCHYGPQNFEVYGNTIDTSGVSSPGFWDIHLQGAGEIAIWGNKVTSGSTPIAVQHYRADSTQLDQGACAVAQLCDGDQAGVGSPQDPKDGNRAPLATYRGYPCWHQAGRDGAGTLKPMYAWLNTYTVGGANAPIAIESGTWTGSAAQCANTDAGRINCHIQLNRDIYQYTASFNGTAGTGSGTLAARPATCTPTTESADAGHGGVGYWATDVGAWNRDTPGPDGALYRCSATNTWTLHYTPYTYPHPLQDGDETPDPPKNLRVLP